MMDIQKLKRMIQTRNGVVGGGLLFAVFAVGGFLTLQVTHAATYVANSEAEAGVRTANAVPGDTVGASGGASVMFTAGTPTGGGACDLPKYPTTACTGVPSGTSLVTVSGDFTASTNGQVVDGKKITGKLIVAASNVTVKNSEIYGGVTNYDGTYHGPFTITDSTIGAPSGCDGNAAIAFNQYTATRVYIRNFGDGPRDSGNNILLQDSFILLCSNPGDHSDGFQGYQGGSNVVVKHNTFDQRPAAPDVTAPIFVADGSQGITAQDNLMIGGSFTVRLYGSGFVFSGNKIVNNAWLFGPSSSDCGGITWTNNSLVNIDANYNVTSTVGALSCS